VIIIANTIQTVKKIEATGHQQGIDQEKINPKIIGQDRKPGIYFDKEIISLALTASGLSG
jgi:hypothetical protein